MSVHADRGGWAVRWRDDGSQRSPPLRQLPGPVATEPNLVWKDTVLVPTGQTVDLLLDVTNPGVWLAHCHIAEHHEGGMLLSFTVEP